jgi:CHAT domain-containing protein/tetratricopeptide (TPR) repeat protein
MQTDRSDSEANRTLKINNLFNAARLFQQFGMQEMRLWANVLAAQLIQLHLHDHSMVYSLTREILADLKDTRMQTIELATMQLQSAALIGLKRSGNLPAPANGSDPIQSTLSRLAELANAMGYDFERSRALNASGQEYLFESFYSKALERFQVALAIAALVGDTELETGIRESIAEVHALQGNTVAKSAALQEIETQLVKRGGGDELALNLLTQGRLLMANRRFPQALDILSQALGQQNNSAIRKQINFELAKVFYETGHLDASLEYLKLAEINPVSEPHKRVNPVIDVVEGLWVMANIQRARGAYEQMKEARNAQGQYQPPQARFLYDQGLDALASAGRNRQPARSFFKQSYTAAGVAGRSDLQHLSRLQVCALGGSGADTQNLCSKAGVDSSYASLVIGGVPEFAIQAMFLRARILVSNGQHTLALKAMADLVDEVHLLRYFLPGVMGAWYQEHHEHLFEYYLELLQPVSSQRGRTDGSASLLALSKIRLIGKYTGSDPVSSVAPGVIDLLRVRLSERRKSAPGQALAVLNSQINRDLDSLRTLFKARFEYLSTPGLQNYLRGLGHDEMVLTYHVGPHNTQVWAARRATVEHRSIANTASVYDALKESRQGLADIGLASFENKMDALGRHLLVPVADLLTTTIYWIPAGPLLGFPLDALRLKGEYLIERHSVIKLLSFPEHKNPGERLQSMPLETVFLAGHPRDYSNDYADRLDTSTEIQAVADIFVGPGLHIVQGVALLPDEFQDGHFRESNLVHLSMPGIIDLNYPEQSGLELSGDETSPRRAALTSADIRTRKMSAGLVFLSGTRMNGGPHSVFSSQPGLVSDFLEAGVNSVINSLWTVNGKFAEAFIVDFYRELKSAGNIADSIRTAKRRYLENNRDDGLYDWAAYQLYTN